MRLRIRAGLALAAAAALPAFAFAAPATAAVSTPHGIQGARAGQLRPDLLGTHDWSSNGYSLWDNTSNGFFYTSSSNSSALTFVSGSCNGVWCAYKVYSGQKMTWESNDVYQSSGNYPAAQGWYFYALSNGKYEIVNEQAPLCGSSYQALSEAGNGGKVSVHCPSSSGGNLAAGQEWSD